MINTFYYNFTDSRNVFWIYQTQKRIYFFLPYLFTYTICPRQQFIKSIVDIIKLIKFYYKIISPKSLLRVRNG